MLVRYNTTVLPGYRVGDDGSVSRWVSSRKAWRPLAITPKGTVYVAVNKRNTTLTVGRLVLSAFGEPRPLGFRVLHFPDPDPRNNHIDNLRWAPANAHREGDPRLREYARRNRSGERSRILTDEEAAEALDMLSRGITAIEVAEHLDVHRGVIDRLIAGSYPHLPRPEGIAPVGDRWLRGDDHPMRKFDDDNPD